MLAANTGLVVVGNAEVCGNDPGPVVVVVVGGTVVVVVGVVVVVDTTVVVPALWPVGPRAAEWLLPPPWARTKPTAAAATQANKSTTALLRRTDLDWRRLTGTWISNRMVAHCRRARLRRWSRQVGTTSLPIASEGTGRSGATATVGGEALADSSEQAHAFEVELSQSVPHFASHPARRKARPSEL
jgi:hypothetical protein